MTPTIFKTISLGGPKPKLKDIEISSWAREILDKVSYQKNKESVDLVVLTPGDLGFTSAPTTTELYAKAREKGYDLCPAEIGPRLRDEYRNQPNGEWLYVGMEPTPDSGGDPRVFLVGRRGDGGLWLSYGWAIPTDRWGRGLRVLFRLRQVSAQTSESKNSSKIPSLELSEIRVNGKLYRLIEE